jgi:hypothetical protein
MAQLLFILGCASCVLMPRCPHLQMHCISAGVPPDGKTWERQKVRPTAHQVAMFVSRQQPCPQLLLQHHWQAAFGSTSC